MQTNYKIAIVGLGSIGTRHLHNVGDVLTQRGVKHSLDLIRSGRQRELNNETARKVNRIYYLNDSVPADYDVIFVTNPTHLHLETIQQFINKTKHMFVEKPLFDRTDIDLESLSLDESSIYYVACPLRYTDIVQYFKHNIDLRNVYCARVICSSYLPEWRPNADYTKTYSASTQQGGGVSLDLIHEWDYLCYLFGYPDQVFNVKGQFSNLEIDSDDLSLYISKYPNMAAEVHLDYFGRKTIREIQLFMDNDTIIGDLIHNEIRFLKSGEVLSFEEQQNDFFCKEITHFFDMLEGRAVNDNDFFTALRTLKIAKGEV